MNKTNLTNNDLRIIFEKMFKQADEEILLTNEYGESEKKSMVDYLNLEFYSWKNRLDSGQDGYSDYEEWVDSLNLSLDKSFAMVELLDAEVTPSPDLDNGVYEGTIRFLIQTEKVSSLDYYIQVLRSKYLGKPEVIKNMYGDTIKAYFLFGVLTYDNEISMSQVGEVIETTVGFRITYMSEALVDYDVKVSLSFDGDDEYNENGNPIDDTKYLTVPFIKSTWQTIFVGDPIPKASRPDLTGIVNKNLSKSTTLSFYDFNKELTNRVNDIFWTQGAINVNGVKADMSDINIPVFVKIRTGGKFYVYKYVITHIEKAITNGEFNITSLSMKLWAKN